MSAALLMRTFNFLIIFSFSLSHGINISYGFQNVELKNKLFIAPIENAITRESVMTRSRLECIEYCVRTKFCFSVLHHSLRNECRMYKQDFLDGINAVDEIGWKYFHVFKDKGLDMSQCKTEDGYEFRPDLGTCYKYISKGETYHKALQNCKTSTGGNLVRVDRLLKQRDVEAFLEKFSIPLASQIRIAGYFQGPYWVFEDGMDFVYYNWNKANDQPEGQNGIALSKEFYYFWHDVSDDRKLPYICEISTF